MTATPENLRAALEVYVQTIPMRKNLEEYLNRNFTGCLADDIQKELDSALATAEDYLWNYPGGVPWTDAFKKEYEALLSSRHPWMDRQALDRILAFSGWLCWHEGLNK
jgi:hypothetical protein